MAQLTPTIQRRDTQRTDWLDWLYEHPAFRFQLKGFFVTLRREPQRHAEFWYAYKKIDGRLRKLYVGRSEDLTYERLVEIVEKFRYL
jgi:LuxR family maltose regulon positive regulatory protein